MTPRLTACDHALRDPQAVNFAIADWLPWGQDAISKYRSYKHLAAFSLQKLLCNIAETPVEQLLDDGARGLQQVTGPTSPVCVAPHRLAPIRIAWAVRTEARRWLSQRGLWYR